jgi:hypothetical protein
LAHRRVDDAIESEHFGVECGVSEGLAEARMSFMDAAYSLYDALVEINVPSEKARAVAQALERDVTATFATKTDLESTRIALRADIETLGKDLRAEMASLAKQLRAEMESLSKELRAEMASLSKELRAEMASLAKELRAEMASLSKELRAELASVRSDMVKLRLELIIWMGGVQVLVAGVLFTALQLTLGR